MYLTITDQGDESVGIFSESWDVPCPFCMEDVDSEDLKIFKASAISLYSQYASGRVVAQYDFEILAVEAQYNKAFPPVNL